MNKLKSAVIFVAGAALALSSAPLGAQEAARPSLGVRVAVQEQGPVVVEILPNRTAAAIGFQVGDILLEAGGRPISQEVLQEYWQQVQAGDQVRFKVQRAGAVVELTGPAVAAPEGAQPPAAPPQQ